MHFWNTRNGIMNTLAGQSLRSLLSIVLDERKLTSETGVEFQWNLRFACPHCFAGPRRLAKPYAWTSPRKHSFQQDPFCIGRRRLEGGSLLAFKPQAPRKRLTCRRLPGLAFSQRFIKGSVEETLAFTSSQLHTVLTSHST